MASKFDVTEDEPITQPSRFAIAEDGPLGQPQPGRFALTPADRLIFDDPERTKAVMDHILFSGKSIEETGPVLQSQIATQIIEGFEDPEEKRFSYENTIMLSFLFDLPFEDAFVLAPSMAKELYGKQLADISASVVNKNLKEDVVQALRETPENLRIGTIGLAAATLEAMKRRSIQLAGGGIFPDEAIKHQFEAITPSPEPSATGFKFPPDKLDFIRQGPPLPGAVTAEVFGILTRLPDIGAKIIRSKQKRRQEAQDIATISNAPITRLSRLVFQSGVPSMGVAVGVSLLTGNPMIGLVVLGETEGAAAFEQQLQAGGSVRKALIIGELSGAAEIGGEMLVLPKLVRGITEGISIRKALTLVVENALQEGVTGFNQEFLSVFGLETTKGTDSVTAAKMAFVAGYRAIPENAFVGGATAGLVDVAATPVSIIRGRRATKAEARRLLDDIVQQVDVDIDAEVAALDVELRQIQQPTPARVAPEAVTVAPVAEVEAEAVIIPPEEARAELEALSYKEVQTEAKRRGIRANQKKQVLIEQITAKPEAKVPVVEGKVTITDRIDSLKGVEKSFWKDQELTIYYDEKVPKETINIRVQKELADKRLIDSVKKINLLSTEKGTFEEAAPAAEAVAEELPAIPEAKRIISREAFDAAVKRLTDPTKLRAGLDPQDIADAVVVGGYLIETGVRKFSDWSGRMVTELGERIRPHLQNIWQTIQTERDITAVPAATELVPLPGETKDQFRARVREARGIEVRPREAPAAKRAEAQRRRAREFKKLSTERLRQQIENEAIRKGLTKKRLSDLKLEQTGFRTLTGKNAVKKITDDQLQNLLRTVILDRPNVVEHKTVITIKTETQIEQLKNSLTEANLMNDMEFENILGIETNGKLPKYISAEAFVTQTQGREVINRMHDVSEKLRAIESLSRALRRKPAIGLEHDKLKDRTESILGIKSPTRLLSMRYFVQKMSERSGDPIYHIYQDLIHTHQKATRERRKLLNSLEALPGFTEIAGNERALQRVSDFISSQSTLENKPKAPVAITQNEIAIAKRIQEIFRLYELQARLGKFFEHKENLTKMPQYLRYKEEIDRALEIYDTEGFDPLVKYLRTQPWGIIRSGYEPMESVIRKVSTHRMPDIAIGKSHIKVRGIVYTKQDRNILQRLDSYMRQMDMLSFLQPKIKALVRTTSDSLALYDEPRIVSNAISTFLDNIKRTNNEDGLVEEVFRKIYSQAITTLVLADISKPVRNLLQNAAFSEDRRDFIKLTNKLRKGEKLLTSEETEHLQTFVHQDRVMLSDWAFTGEEAFNFPVIGQFRFGINKLTKWVQKRTLYPGSDRINRTMSFSAKINRVKTAFAREQSLAEKMKEARFTDMQKQEQQLALGILARDGVDAMARYIAKVHTDNTHFLYAREQRSPAEQTKLGKMTLNLALFKRAALEKAILQLQKTFETATTFQARKRAAFVFVNLIVWSTLVSLLWKKATGKRIGAYDFINFLQFEAGGLQLGAVESITDIYNDMLRATKGDTAALSKLAVAIPKSADMFIPFYDLGLRAVEATVGTEHIDREAIRQVREMIDEEYRSRGLERVQRSLIEKLQFVITKGKPKEKR